MLFVDLINASFFVKLVRLLFLCSPRIIPEFQDMKTCRMTRLDSLHEHSSGYLVPQPAQTQHLNLVCDCFSFEIFSIKLWTRKRFADHHLL